MIKGLIVSVRAQSKPIRKPGDDLFNPVEERQVSEGGAAKGAKVVEVSRIPVEFLSELAAQYHEGAKKYPDVAVGRPNYLEGGYAYTLSYNAAQRHMMLWVSGEDNDKETGKSHLAAAAFHLATLLTYQARGLGTDDRPVIRRA